MFRPALPNDPYGGSVKAPVLNQRVAVGSLTLGFPDRFGRSFAPNPSDERPVLLLSFSGRSATVNGRPLCIATIPLTVQPPSAASSASPRPRANGTSYEKLTESLCRTSKLDRPHSASRLALS